jgi:hypothetical protein
MAATKKESKLVQKPAEDVPVSDEIKIPSLNIQRAHVRIRGTSALITHAWSEKAKKEIRDKQMQEARLAKAAKDPEADFNDARYVVDGKDCFPAAALKKAIVKAGALADEKMTVLRVSIFVIGSLGNGQFIEILNAKPEKREDMVKINRGLTSDMRYRPQYVDWKAEFDIDYNANIITPQKLFNFINIAGFSIGICEWRPEKSGEFGRFEIDHEDAMPVAAE